MTPVNAILCEVLVVAVAALRVARWDAKDARDLKLTIIRAEKLSSYWYQYSMRMERWCAELTRRINGEYEADAAFTRETEAWQRDQDPTPHVGEFPYPIGTAANPILTPSGDTARWGLPSDFYSTVVDE
jgi:hypothetical protein